MTVLTQAEADTLKAIEKYLLEPGRVKLPRPQTTNTYNLKYTLNSKNMQDMKVSAYRGKKNPDKVSYRLIYGDYFILLRIDTKDNTPHQNPDGTLIAPLQPHIHIYKEGYRDKYAYPLPKDFSDAENIMTLFIEFLTYSTILNADKVQLVEQEVLFDGL